MTYYHLLNATHLYVFVAICPAALGSLRSMNSRVVIELLVCLLNCCVVIKRKKKLRKSDINCTTF